MVQREKIGSVLVVGAGVGGMRAAIDLADAGIKVYLVEQLSSVGGVVSQLGFMFPTHDCVLCRGTSDHGYGCTRPSITPWLLDYSQHPAVELMTLTDLVAVRGQPGHFVVSVRHRPRYVDPGHCINCNRCAEVCPVELPDPFHMGLSNRKAVGKYAARAVPDAYYVERGDYCDDCRKCVSVCPTGAIDLDEEAWTEDLHVGAIILTVGYKVHDPSGIAEYGYGRYPNVITSLEYERLTSLVVSGPTGGLLRRRSDGRLPRKLAWIQCVGSRNQEHPYCSSICCMYATKEAMLAKQRLPGVEATIFLMDQRAFSKAYSAYTRRAEEVFGVRYVRNRVSVIHEDPVTHDLIVRHQSDEGVLREERFDMIVLSVGSEPPAQSKQLAQMLDIELNEYGFCRTEKFEPVDTTRPGVYVAGAFAMPKEITESIIDASGAVAQAIQLLSGTQHQLDVAQLPPMERDVAGEKPRVGVFACLCGGEISDVVDVPDVLAYARTLPDVVYTSAVSFGCQESGLEEILRAIRQKGINRVVIGACSPRTHEALFQALLSRARLNPYLLEFVSLRESCSWVHHDNPAGATRKARELVRYGVGRARKLQPIQQLQMDYTRSALILGGGVAGLRAALTIAEQGYDVYLVEKQKRLGGNVRNLHFTAEGDNPRQMLRNLTKRVESHERIAVYKETELIQFQGTKGNFVSTLRGRRNGSEQVEEWDVAHGVTIVATGASEFRAPVYFLGEDERTVTQLELEALIAEHPAQINRLMSVTMIQCVGPWSYDGSTEFYCSRTCCTNTMKNAIRIKVINPSCQVVVLYKELMTYGFREKYYTEARERGVLFVRYTDETPPHVYHEGEQLKVRVHDHILHEDLILTSDLLALSTAAIPSESTSRLAEMLSVPLSPEGFFMEDNLKLRPMDFTREGVFLCGAAHYPKFSEEAIAHALATSARAMTILGKDKLEATVKFAQVDQAKCVGCLTCVRTCPYHIPKIDAGAVGVGGIIGAAYIEPTLCTGCGTCTSECPANAIQLLHYRDEQIMVPDMAVLGQWCPICVPERA
ncbi:MAG: CoB--CoM heterodisulfide reductase iron-sulfur subunit A family protein [Anaerolineae bacterium]|nr:CoB--CoM heterodisulfide reductase iron-sulfur subunit A family protein [Anaerolineae bacterium]